MRSLRSVEIRKYRDHAPEVIEGPGDGWAVVTHAPGPQDRLILRNHVPHGLQALLLEAKAHVDRRTDRATDPSYP